jgi:hypothetical protein
LSLTPRGSDDDDDDARSRGGQRSNRSMRSARSARGPGSGSDSVLGNKTIEDLVMRFSIIGLCFLAETTEASRHVIELQGARAVMRAKKATNWVTQWVFLYIF